MKEIGTTWSPTWSPPYSEELHTVCIVLVKETIHDFVHFIWVTCTKEIQMLKYCKDILLYSLTWWILCSVYTLSLYALAVCCFVCFCLLLFCCENSWELFASWGPVHLSESFINALLDIDLKWVEWGHTTNSLVWANRRQQKGREAPGRRSLLLSYGWYGSHGWGHGTPWEQYIHQLSLRL